MGVGSVGTGLRRGRLYWLRSAAGGRENICFLLMALGAAIVDVTILCFGGFQTVRLHEVVAQGLVAAVDPQAAVAAQ